jgi:predicted HTH domain antitoxin
MGVTITTRVSDEIEEEIRSISKREQLDRSTVVRRLLVDGIKDWKVKYALEQYSEGKITIWKAARLAGVSLRQMLDIAAKKGIPFQYTLEDLREDFRGIE